MTISESQLNSWANQGATTIGQNTYTSIKTALSASTSPIRHLIGNSVQIYLQGSYRNNTNVRGDSDIDVVVEYNGAWGSDLKSLTPEEVQLYNDDHGPADYTFNHLRNDVIVALQRYYGDQYVKPGNKSVKVLPSSGRLKADVVPAVLYKKFHHYYGRDYQGHTAGMKFVAQHTNRIVVNYPKQHIQNGQTKNSETETNGWYKPTIRMVKNARTTLVDIGYLQDGEAPSYFIESLLYNVPYRLYGISYKTTFENVLNYLVSLDEAVLLKFPCQNKMLPLFGDTEEQWNIQAAYALLGGLKFKL